MTWFSVDIILSIQRLPRGYTSDLFLNSYSLGSKLVKSTPCDENKIDDENRLIRCRWRMLKKKCDGHKSNLTLFLSSTRIKLLNDAFKMTRLK